MTAVKRDLRDYLNTLVRPDGLLLAQDVVEDAKRPESLLHDSFPWDDAIAANEHRLQIARQIIRSVKINVTVNHIVLDVPEWGHVTTTGKQIAGYRKLDAIKEHEDYRRELLHDEVERAKAAISRTLGIAGELGCVDEVQHILALLVTLESRYAAAA